MSARCRLQLMEPWTRDGVKCTQVLGKPGPISGTSGVPLEAEL